jgi:hypothetical protein
MTVPPCSQSRHFLTKVHMKSSYLYTLHHSLAGGNENILGSRSSTGNGIGSAGGI